jgi:hypothetical protein
MAIPKQTQQEIDALIAEITSNMTEPEFCSLDEIVDLPQDFSDPYFLILREEKRRGIPMAFQREIDEEIRDARRNLLS